MAGDFFKRKPGSRRSADWNYGGTKWRLSRSKIDLFVECKRCFYLDNKLGISKPRGPSFTLNVAVDALLKKEFDVHRVAGTAHPYMKAYGIDAIPFKHEYMEIWRDNFKGVECIHTSTGLTICGAVDDIWINTKGELITVDYKATSKDGKIEILSDSSWEGQYKRQMEIYQWLLRRNGFPVSDTGYFVYVNGKKDNAAFDGKLEFDVSLIPHVGKDDWIEGVLVAIKKCLDDDRIPLKSEECEFCAFVDAVNTVVRERAVIVKDAQTATKAQIEKPSEPVKKRKSAKAPRVSKRMSKNTVRKMPTLF